jgi:hypothetical protein
MADARMNAMQRNLEQAEKSGNTEWARRIKARIALLMEPPKPKAAKEPARPAAKEPVKPAPRPRGRPRKDVIIATRPTEPEEPEAAPEPETTTVPEVTAEETPTRDEPHGAW